MAEYYNNDNQSITWEPQRIEYIEVNITENKILETLKKDGYTYTPDSLKLIKAEVEKILAIYENK